MVNTVAVIAIVVGPICLIVGILLGAQLQYRAQAKLPPPKFPGTPLPKSEVIPAEKPAGNGEELKMAEWLGGLTVEDLQDRAQFFNVRWDERPQERDRIITEIVQSHFHPGAYRA